MKPFHRIEPDLLRRLLRGPRLLALLCLLATILPTVAGGATSLTAVIVLPDDGKSAFIEEIDAAEESVRLYLYLLSDDDIIRALMRANLRDVDVRVILEPEPYGGAQTELETWQRLEAAGIDVRWSPAEYRFAHVKLLVVDRAVAVIMNLNMTGAAFTQNREFALLTTDVDLIGEASALFDADWQGDKPPAPGRLVVSPIDSRTRLTELIDSARTSLELYAEVLTDPGIVDALIAALDRGVAVRLLMSASDEESLWYEEPGFLARSGAQVRIASHLYIHAKAIVVDGERLWIGSQNFTANSLDENREVGMMTSELLAVERVRSVFETDWSASAQLAGSGDSGS